MRVDISEFITYVKEYLKHASLNHYFQSDADNRAIYLHQAMFSTQLLKWFQINMDKMDKALEVLKPV